MRKSFGALEVLKGVSIDVMKGEVICIIGPSGSGKSTLIRCINGLNDIQGGSIFVQGKEVHSSNQDKLELRKKVGMVFQQYNLFPHKTALENVMMAPLKVLKEKKTDVEARARQLIKKVRLEGKEDNYPGELSGGQQQRVAIARSLAMNPDVMLFDEVTAALDPETVKEVLVTFRDQRDSRLGGWDARLHQHRGVCQGDCSSPCMSAGRASQNLDSVLLRHASMSQPFHPSEGLRNRPRLRPRLSVRIQPDRAHRLGRSG